MQLIESLFNQYRHAPLTKEVLNYHQQLIQRLQSDIYQTALAEQKPELERQLQQMIVAMQTWTKMRLTNQPFQFKMKNFKLVTENHPQFKARHLKGHTQQNHHASRH
jgi:hypothetical protein